jgi:hypothetical protein
MCFETNNGASCSANNMFNFPQSLDINKLGNGGGCSKNLCNAVAAKQGRSAACCPYPCGANGNGNGNGNDRSAALSCLSVPHVA